jgi:hypothetical protein
MTLAASDHVLQHEGVLLLNFNFYVMEEWAEEIRFTTSRILSILKMEFSGT